MRERELTYLFVGHLESGENDGAVLSSLALDDGQLLGSVQDTPPAQRPPEATPRVRLLPLVGREHLLKLLEVHDVVNCAVVNLAPYRPLYLDLWQRERGNGCSLINIKGRLLGE